MNREQSSGSADINFMIKPFGGVWQVKRHLGLSAVGNSYIDHIFQIPLKAEAKCLIKMQVESVTANDTDISAGFSALLENNFN